MLAFFKCSSNLACCGGYRQAVDINCQIGIALIERTAFVVKTPQSHSRITPEHNPTLVKVSKAFDEGFV